MTVAHLVRNLRVSPPPAGPARLSGRGGSVSCSRPGHRCAAVRDAKGSWQRHQPLVNPAPCTRAAGEQQGLLRFCHCSPASSSVLSPERQRDVSRANPVPGAKTPLCFQIYRTQFSSPRGRVQVRCCHPSHQQSSKNKTQPQLLRIKPVRLLSL